MHHTPCRPAAGIRCSTCVTSAMQRAQDEVTSPHTLLTCKTIITQDKRVHIQNKNSFAARGTVPLLDCTSMIAEMILGSYADTDKMVRLAYSREAFQLRLFHKAGEPEAYPGSSGRRTRQEAPRSPSCLSPPSGACRGQVQVHRGHGPSRKEGHEGYGDRRPAPQRAAQFARGRAGPHQEVRGCHPLPAPPCGGHCDVDRRGGRGRGHAGSLQRVRNTAVVSDAMHM